MKWAVLKGRDLLRFEYDGTSELPPGARRLPVVIQEKPPHDPATQYLDSYHQVSDDGSCVGILYTVNDKPPEVASPSAPPVVVERVVERIVEQVTDANVEALRRQVAEMQAAQAETQAAARIGDLIGTAINGSTDAAEAAATALIPFATERGMTVPEFVLWWVSRDKIKGAA